KVSANKNTSFFCGFCAFSRPTAFPKFIPSWFLGKKKAQVVQGEGLREGLLAEDVLDERGFAALELADFLFDAVFHQETISHDLAGLADAMGAVDGLHFHRRVPPRVEQHDVAGGREVQPKTAGLQGDQEDRRSVGVLKSLDQVPAILGVACEVKMRPVALFDRPAQNVEHGDELRKDQHLVAFVHQRFEQVQQRIDLGAFGLAQILADKRRVTAYLTQPQQRGEKMEALLVEFLLRLDAQE